MSYSAQSAPAPPGCTPRRSPTPWRSRSPNRTARAPSRSRTQTYRSPVTSPTPGFSRIAQLCGEATAATARDDAAQLSAERRLQVAHQFVGVDDAARGDTELMPGGVLQLHRWGLLEAVVAAGTPAVRAGQFSYGDAVEEVEVAEAGWRDA